MVPVPAPTAPPSGKTQVMIGSHAEFLSLPEISMAVQVKWDMSPVSGATYTIHSEVIGVPGSSSTYNTTPLSPSLAYNVD